MLTSVDERGVGELVCAVDGDVERARVLPLLDVDGDDVGPGGAGVVERVEKRPAFELLAGDHRGAAEAARAVVRTTADVDISHGRKLCERLRATRLLNVASLFREGTGFREEIGEICLVEG
jgi:hypothetical protein